MSDSTADIRFALSRLLDDSHRNGYPKLSITSNEFACTCGLNRARAIAIAATNDSNWKVVR